MGYWTRPGYSTVIDYYHLFTTNMAISTRLDIKHNL